jgi:hypothetical protein
MYFGLGRCAIRKADVRNAFSLPPALATVTLTKTTQRSYRSAAGDRLDVSDFTENLHQRGLPKDAT